MNHPSPTPEPPYYAVIFTSLRAGESEEYEQVAAELSELVTQQPGFLGQEHARNELGITVSYWTDLKSIEAWKEHARHLYGQRMGKENWYSNYRIRIALVQREYGHP